MTAGFCRRPSIPFRIVRVLVIGRNRERTARGDFAPIEGLQPGSL